MFGIFGGGGAGLTDPNKAGITLANLAAAYAPMALDSPAYFKHGNGTNAPTSSGDEFGNLRSPFAFIKNNMSKANGAFGGDATEWVLHVGGFVPLSAAPTTFSEQKGGIYVSIRSGRESNNTAQFSDLTGIQVNTNVISGVVEGRAYSLHLNNTIDNGANAQAVGAEIELNQIGGAHQPNLFANDQKTLLQLVPIGKTATKGIMFGINTGGMYDTMMYTETSYVRPTLETPVPYATGPAGTNYGGSFFRIGQKYRQGHINGEVFETIGPLQPVFSPALVRHIKKDATVDAFDKWEMINTGGNGWLHSAYVVTGILGKSIGLDRTTREIRISNAEGLADGDVLLGTHQDYVNLLGTTTDARFRFQRDGDNTWAKIGKVSFAFASIGLNSANQILITRGNDLTAAAVFSGVSSGVSLGQSVGWTGGAGIINIPLAGSEPATLFAGVAIWHDDATNSIKYRKAGDTTVRTINFT